MIKDLVTNKNSFWCHHCEKGIFFPISCIEHADTVVVQADGMADVADSDEEDEEEEEDSGVRGNVCTLLCPSSSLQVCYVASHKYRNGVQAL